MPNDINALISQGVNMMRIDEHQKALPFLDRAIDQSNENAIALANRGIINLKLDRLDQAEKDYSTIAAVFAKRSADVPFQISYGLGETAYRKKDYKKALLHYESYMKFAPPGTSEALRVQERVKELKAAKKG